MITSIMRDWGTNPSIVRISSTNTLAQVVVADYLSTQADIISELNNGPFEWVVGDMVAMAASDGNNIFSFVDDDFNTLVALPSSGGGGGIVLPTKINHIATYTDVNGTLSEDPTTAISGGNIQAGLSGQAGSLISFPSNGLRGNLQLVASNNFADYTVQITNDVMFDSRTFTIPDSGTDTTFILADNAIGQIINSGSFQILRGDLISGHPAGLGFDGKLSLYPSIAGSPFILLASPSNAPITVTATGAPSSRNYTIPDTGTSTANFLMDQGSANIKNDYEQFIGLNYVLYYSAGTWTTTRIAQANYASRHTPAAETVIIGIDITPAIRLAMDKGFRLDTIFPIYSIDVADLNSHTITLDLVNYLPSSPVTVTSVLLDGSLDTLANGTDPYVGQLSINTPVFDNTLFSKYVIEITLDAATTTAYDYYGLILGFSQTIA